MRQQTISPSQLDAFSCRLQWHWSYVERLQGKRSSIALELGTGIHWALEQYYSIGMDVEEAFLIWGSNRIMEMERDGLLRFDDDREEIEKAIKLGTAMMINYRDYARENDNFTVLATERMLKRRLPVPGKNTFAKIWIRARLDGIVRDHETGNIFSLEHKTMARFSLSELDKNPQFSVQIYLGETALKEMGINEPIVGLLYNGLRKTAPGPRVKLALNERHTVYRNQHEIDVALHRAYWVYRDMVNPNTVIYPNPNTIRCSGCGFKEPCTEWMRGGDYQFLLDTLYTKVEPQV